MKKTDFLMTKIIATLGPASSSVDMITQLIQAGARVFRINFSHGKFSEYDLLIANIREAEQNTGEFVAILGDISGPKIRVGKIMEGGIFLKKDTEIIFSKKEVPNGESFDTPLLSTTYPAFIDEVKPGERILLDDGNIELSCIRRDGHGEDATLICLVKEENLLTSSKGINLPDTELSLPSMTEKDFLCVEYAVKQNLDFLALSFVRSRKDVLTLKDKLREQGVRPKELGITGHDFGFSTAYEDTAYIPIISKIEKPQAIHNLEEIIEESDGVMVARGDLGVEMDLAEVAILQKQIVHLCRKEGKPVIVATQMLQSMILDPTPTRAEVSDVANAIIDGVDAIMLSGETAVGKYPVAAVKMMSRISVKTHGFIRKYGHEIPHFIKREGLPSRKSAMSHGVADIGRDIEAKYIITWSHSGGSTMMISQQRLDVPIIAFGDCIPRLRQLALLYGVNPILKDQPESGSRFIADINDFLLQDALAEEGDPLVIVASDPITKRGLTNRIVIHYLGENVE
jgi:pyruvate kinase